MYDVHSPILCGKIENGGYKDESVGIAGHSLEALYICAGEGDFE